MEGRGSLSARFAFQRSLPAAKCAGLTKAFLSPPGPAAAARMASRRRGLMHTRTVCPAPGPCTQPETSEQPLWEEKLPLKWRPPQKKPPLHLYAFTPAHLRLSASYQQNTCRVLPQSVSSLPQLGSDDFFFMPIVPGVVQDGDIDLVHICCLNESQILSVSRGGLEVLAGCC